MRRILWLMWLGCLVLAVPAPGRGQEPALPDSTAIQPVPLRFDGTGTSAWGTIPAAAADTLAMRPKAPGLSAWEIPVAGLWWLIKLPFSLLNYGIQSAFGWWDRVPFLDTVADWVGRLPQLGVRLAAEWTPSGGFAYGVRVYEHRPFEGNLNLQYAHSASARGDLYNFAGIRLFAPRRTNLDLVAGYRRRGAERFYGIGPVSHDDDLVYFAGRNVWAGASMRGRLVQDLAVGVSAFYSDVRNGAPRAERDDPRMDEVFAGELPYGWGSDSYGLTWGLELSHDDTIGRGRGVRGGVRRVSVSYFDPTGGIGDRFTHYRVSLEQFFCGSSPADRQLALKLIWSWQDDREGFTHFQRLLTNDQVESFRGYQDFRFRDRGIAGFTAEYRYPVWDYGQVPGRLGLDGYVFWDTGQVFSAHHQIRLEALTHSLGIGIRLVTADEFMVRAELAGSREDLVARLAVSQVFQRTRGGLYDGRLPIPTR